MIDNKAAHSASMPGASNCSPPNQATIFVAPLYKMPMATVSSATPIKVIASVSYLP